MGLPPVLDVYGVEGEVTKADGKVKSIRSRCLEEASLLRGSLRSRRISCSTSENMMVPKREGKNRS